MNGDFALFQEEENIIAESCLTGYDEVVKRKTAQSVASYGSRKSAVSLTSSAASSQASSQRTVGSTKVMRKYVPSAAFPNP
jgi:hypothetical protein